MSHTVWGSLADQEDEEQYELDQLSEEEREARDRQRSLAGWLGDDRDEAEWGSRGPSSVNHRTHRSKRKRGSRRRPTAKRKARKKIRRKRGIKWWLTRPKRR